MTCLIHLWGYQLLLGLCMVPAIMLLPGSILLDDTPNSLCEQGYPDKVCLISML